jgi:hypothetical protein
MAGGKTVFAEQSTANRQRFEGAEINKMGRQYVQEWRGRWRRSGGRRFGVKLGE